MPTKRGIFIFIFLTLSTLLFSQKKKTIESVYKLKVRENVSDLPAGTDSTITINARIKVIRDDQLCLLVILESSIENEILSSSAHSENYGDTLLFDSNTKRVYSSVEKKSYWYKLSVMEQPSVLSDTITLHDTTIVLSNRLDKLTNPSPTLKEMGKGVATYATKTFSFLYETSAQTNFSLYAVLNRYKNFAYTNQKTVFVY